MFVVSGGLDASHTARVPLPAVQVCLTNSLEIKTNRVFRQKHLKSKGFFCGGFSSQQYNVTEIFVITLALNA